MDLGRFHHAIDTLLQDYKTSKTKAQLQNLIEALNQLANNTGDEAAATSFRNKLEELRKSLDSSSLNATHQTLREIFSHINAFNYFGNKLFSRITEAISSNQLTPNLAAAALKKLLDDLEKFYGHLSQIETGFSALKVECTEISSGQCEIGIILPIEQSSKTLKDLSKEANKWHNALSAFSEVYDPANEPITIRTLATGSWLFYLSSTAGVLLGISVCMKNLNSVLRELVQTKELIKQLASNGIGPDAIAAVERDIEGKLDSKIKLIAKDTVEKNYKGQPERGNELENQISQGLKFIALKMNEGAKIELRISQMEKPVSKPGEELDGAEKLIAQQAEQCEKIAAEVQSNMSQIDFDAEKLKSLELLSSPLEEEQKT